MIAFRTQAEADAYSANHPGNDPALRRVTNMSEERKKEVRYSFCSVTHEELEKALGTPINELFLRECMGEIREAILKAACKEINQIADTAAYEV